MVEQKKFKNKDTEKVWNRIFIKKWSRELQKQAWEETATLLAFASNLNQLKEVFGTDLEKLKGRRKGQYSIRINDQFRICFVWEKGKVYDLELVDYHGERK